MENESQVIAEIILTLQHPRTKEGRDQYHMAFTSDGVKIKGYEFRRFTYCFVVWKPTDFQKDPQWKGEPLCKIVPDTILTKQQIETILEAQPWLYE